MKLQSILLGQLMAAIGHPKLMTSPILKTLQNLPHWAFGVLAGAVAIVLWQGYLQWRRSVQKAQKPSEGWAITEAVLQPLLRQGWKKKERVSLKGSGTLDILLTSPHQKYYCVSLQNHRGKICSDGRQIFRVYDSSQRPFEKDLLAGVRQQVADFKKQYHLTAIPILTFPEAIVEIQENPVAGVYVTGRLDLRACLLQLDRH